MILHPHPSTAPASPRSRSAIPDRTSSFRTCPLRLHPGRGLPCVRRLAPASSAISRALQTSRRNPAQGRSRSRPGHGPARRGRSSPLLGEIEALPATGDPPGEHPDLELVVQLRAADAGRAELRLWAAPDEPWRLSLLGAAGSMTLEFDPDLTGRPD